MSVQVLVSSLNWVVCLLLLSCRSPASGVHFHRSFPARRQGARGPRGLELSEPALTPGLYITAGASQFGLRLLVIIVDYDAVVNSVCCGW